MAPVLRNQNHDGDASGSNSFSQEDLARIVAEQIAAAIPAIAAHIHADSNNGGGDDDSTGGGPNKKGCSYKTSSRASRWNSTGRKEQWVLSSG
jgi:hypothetical protein